MMSWLGRSLSNRFSVLVGLTMGVALLALGWVSHDAMATALEEAAVERRTLTTQLRAEHLRDFLRSVEGDVEVLRDLPALEGLARAHGQGERDEPYWRQQVGAVFRAFADGKPHYLQLRYLDDAGKEVVRVDAEGGRVSVTPDHGLQDRSAERYFTEPMRLPPGETFISRLELDREHGQIQTPHQPVLRYAAPIYAGSSRPRGVVVGGVNGEAFLEEVRRRAEGVDVFMVNEEGYYLAHPDPARQWGFDLGRETTLAADLGAAAAQTVLSGQTGHLADVNGKLVVYQPIAVDPHDAQRRWVVVAAVDREVLMEPVRKFSHDYRGIIVVLLALGVAVSVFFARRLARPLRQVTALADAIAAGDLRQEPLAVASRDEIGRLADSCNSMLQALRDIAARTRQGTESLTAAAGQILASTRQQAASTAEQLAAIQETTSTVEEINQSGAQIAERARTVAAAAEATAASSAAGTQAVDDAVRAIDAIGDQAETVAGNIVALAERTQAIGQIIASVNDLSEQSNMLALNAAIQAAAAGEHGRSFAVVAEEMKSLAGQAREATVQVQSILQEIQKGINTSVMLTEEAVKRVDTGRGQTQTTRQTIHELSSRIQESVEAFQQIVAATGQQQIGLEQITQALGDIRTAAEQAAAGTRQTEQAVENLDQLGTGLRATAERYRL